MRAFALLAVTAMLFAAGCAKKDDTSHMNNTPPADTAPTTPAPTPAEPAPSPSPSETPPPPDSNNNTTQPSEGTTPPPQ